MIEISVCKNCGRPIYFDWRGAHHVQESQALGVSRFGVYDTRLDFSRPECDDPKEAPEE
jgi:hypothetical protein